MRVKAGSVENSGTPLALTKPRLLTMIPAAATSSAVTRCVNVSNSHSPSTGTDHESVSPASE